MRNAPRNTKEVIRFSKTIPAGTTDVLSERVKGAGTVEGMRVRFYSGQQLALKVYPVIEHKGGLTESLITYVETGNDFLAGDDDRLEMDIVCSVENDDFIKVKAVNTSAFDYTLSLDIIIDYYGGTQRVIGGLL